MWKQQLLVAGHGAMLVQRVPLEGIEPADQRLSKGVGSELTRKQQRRCLLLGVLIWCGAASSVFAADRTTPRDLIAEPPTLISLGFEWLIDGDDNRNAVVTVSYRTNGDPQWTDGLPLLRIGNERIN